MSLALSSEWEAAAAVSCERPCALVTNVVASPFFRLSLDETIVGSPALRVQNSFVVVLADAGNHRLRVEFGNWATRFRAHSLMGARAVEVGDVTHCGRQSLWQRPDDK